MRVSKNDLLTSTCETRVAPGSRRRAARRRCRGAWHRRGDHVEPGDLTDRLRQVRVVSPAPGTRVLADDIPRRAAARNGHQGCRALAPDAALGSGQGVWAVP